jgi:hypothetical protein
MHGPAAYRRTLDPAGFRSERARFGLARTLP